MAQANVVPIVFLATANDGGDRERYLPHLAEEVRQVQRALAAAEVRGLCQLVPRQNATAGDILDVFQDPRHRNRVAIFHFGGHADGYRLLLETAAGKSAAADAGGLARFLAQQRGLQLVFLNGCSTEGQVIDLLDAGVHAIIATDRAVDDAKATTFAARFYSGLAGGATLEAAFKEAEAAMKFAGGAIFRDLGAADGGQGDDRIPWHLHYRDGAMGGWSLPQAATDPFFGLPELPPTALPNRPYLYLDQYTAKHAAIFFGRGREIRALYDRVTALEAERIILYYGQSGVGKSSLLEAGLLPRLMGEHLIHYQRRDHEKRLCGTLRSMLAAAAAEAHVAVGEDETIAQAWLGIEQHAGKPVVLILDQVEECFTRVSQGALGAAEIEQLLAEIHELFIAPQNWPRGRLILGFRKEWLAEIHERVTVQELPFSEVFLERLNRAGIIEVVRGPTSSRLADKFNLSFKDEENLPELIADDLLTDPESPIAVTLQVLLSRMWDRAVAKDRTHPIFDLALYGEMQREGEALGDFLDQQLVALQKSQEEVVRSGLALDILAFHTSDLGTAEEHSMAELKREYHHQANVLPGLIQQARELSLLVDPRPNQPDRPPASRLAHDTLAPLVRQRFSTSDAPGQRARRILESRLPKSSKEEGTEHHPELAPLGDADLTMIEAGQAGMRARRAKEQELVAISQIDRTRRLEEQDRVKQEREQARQREVQQAKALAEQKSKSTTRLRLLVVILAVLALIAPAWWIHQVILKAQARSPLVRIPAADLSAGLPAGQVQVPEFLIERYEVSNLQYGLCVQARACEIPVDPQLYKKPGLKNHPVAYVTAYQSDTYCRWIGRRLPTSMEWERAARSSGKEPWPWGAEPIAPSRVNMLFENSEPTGTAPVDAYAGGSTAGQDGVFQLIGNVGEWTATLSKAGQYDTDPDWTKPLIDWLNDGDKLTVRGGDFQDIAANANWVTETNPTSPSRAEPYLGFRCVQDP